VLIEFQGYRGETMHMLVVEPLGMAASYPQQSGYRLFRHMHQPGRGSDATTFIQMTDNLCGFALGKLGVE
jgi:hypothetical protein